MARQSERKVLRVGLIKNGKVIEEKLLRKPSHVTVGQSEKCTFTLSVDGLPQIYPLIQYKGNDYILVLNPRMQGRLNVDGEALDFETIRSKSIANQSQGQLVEYTLTENARGKVEVGELSILFQFVKPPPAKRKAKLPKDYQKSISQRLDWAFVNAFMVSLLLQGLSLGYVTTQEYPPRDIKLTDISSRFLDIVKKKKPKEVKPDEEKIDKEKDPVKKEPKKVEKKPEELPPPTTVANKQKRRELLTKRVIKRSALSVLMTGDGPSVIGQLTSASTKAAIDSAFDGVDGALASADGDSRPGSIGGDTGDVVSVKGPSVSNKRAKVKSRKRKTKVKAKLKIKAPSEAVGAGTLSPEKIARTISRKYRGAINGCYESELKKDNSLKGALKIQFTISERGRISNSRILRNSLGSKAVGKCIRNHMKRWRFPKPKGGSVTTSIPLVFTPSS